MLTPVTEQKCVYDILTSFKKECDLKIINSKFGHDAMFHPGMQERVFGPMIKEFIEKDFEKVLQHEAQRYSSL